MVSALRVPVLVLGVVAFAASAGAQEIANWPAPATWSPPAEHGRLHTMSVISSALPFIAVTPCRQFDSRNSAPLPQNTVREVVISGGCSINGSAAAVSLNVTVFNILGQTGNAVLQVGTTSNPTTAWINYPPGQGQIGNAGVLPLSANGSIFFRVEQGAGSIDFTIDVNGYYGGLSPSSSNVFLGQGAGNTTLSGNFNTAVGFHALAADGVGGSNTAIGSGALSSNAGGLGNTATGETALNANDSGGFNTASGFEALQNNSSGSRNLALGSDAGINLTTGSDNVDIMNDGVAGESATIRIGTDGVQTRAFLSGVRGVTTGVMDAVGVMIDSAGQLGTVSSSRRVKRDIEDMGEASEALMRLRPVIFRYKASLDPTGSPQYGLVAEEVAEAVPDLVVCDREGQPDTVRYHVLVPMLVNEIQKDRKTIAEDRKAIEDLTARLERLEALMSESNR
jgi:hypothetical protein